MQLDAHDRQEPLKVAGGQQTNATQAGQALSNRPPGVITCLRATQANVCLCEGGGNTTKSFLICAPTVVNGSRVTCRQPGDEWQDARWRCRRWSSDPVRQRCPSKPQQHLASRSTTLSSTSENRTIINFVASLVFWCLLFSVWCL